MIEEGIDIKRWRETACVAGRTATDEDVHAGRAIFAVGGEPVELAIPSCAIVREEGIGEATAVIVVQAERIEDGTVVIGYRMIEGGAGIAPLDDVELLSEPDERFR